MWRNSCFAVLILFGATVGTITSGQSRVPKSENSSLCILDNSVDLIRQQLELTKTFDSAPQRIAVLIRAADLLWIYQENKARSAFTEALELARQNFKEKGDKPANEDRLGVENPDQRYLVISAVAKRDPAWAKKLTNQMLQEEAKEAGDKSTSDHEEASRTAQKLLMAGVSLVSTDPTSALNFAIASLNYPPTLYLTIFLYKLAEVNGQAADEFYLRALASYADNSMNEFLYLSAYPFGNSRDAGEMPAYTIYSVPSAFLPNRTLQRQFLRVLLRRSQSQIAASAALSRADRLSEPGQIWLALTRLQDQIQQSLPDLEGSVEQARRGMSALLSQDSQRRVDQLFKGRHQNPRSFDDQVEMAEKQQDPGRRDQMLAFAILGAATENLERVSNVAERISDSEVRNQLLSWLFFSRAQVAIKNKQLDDARGLASKVPELDRRAYLYSNIAEESIKQTDDQTQARVMLEEVAAAIASAPSTLVTARALLGLAYLYTRIDVNRAIGLLGDAVKCINRLEAPDFSNQYIQIRVEGKTFGFYTGFQTPGFNPENAFREFAKIDYDDALYQASNFADKSTRALTILAVAEICLQRTLPRQKSEKAPKGKSAKAIPTKRRSGNFSQSAQHEGTNLGQPSRYSYERRSQRYRFLHLPDEEGLNKVKN
jgi:hypothetical protein